jgi:hypothetical protein
MGLIDELETCRTPGDRPRPSSRATHADNHDAVAGDRAWLRRTIPHRRRPHRQVIPPSRSAKPLRQATPPSHSAKSHRHVTPPSHTARSHRQVTPPSHSAKSLRQVAPPSHSAKSLRQVAPPSRSAKSLRQVAPPSRSPPGRGWPKAGRGAARSLAKTRQDCGRIRESDPEQERLSPKRACRARSTSPGRRPGFRPLDRPGPVGAVHRGRAESAGSRHSAPTTRFPRFISAADVQQVGKPVPPPRRPTSSVIPCQPHSANSLCQVTPPSHSAKSLRQVTLPRGEGGERPGEGLRGRWQRRGKTAVESEGALPSKSDSPRSEPVGLVLPAQAEGLGFGPQIAPAL